MKPKFNFPPNVYGETRLGLQKNYRNNLLATIELMRRGNTDGQAFSNYSFGWQSQFLPLVGIYDPLVEAIIQKAFIFLKNIGEEISTFNFKTITMENLWANINYTNDVNWPHSHAGDISGVYYLQTPKNCGNIGLLNFTGATSELDIALQDKIAIKPLKAVTDKLILFNSSCHHRVFKNLNKQPRISVSFNMKIKNN